MNMRSEEKQICHFLYLDESFVDKMGNQKVRYCCSNCNFYRDIHEKSVGSFLKAMRYCNCCGVKYYRGRTGENYD